ncbi:Pkinase-domain-containing protein, partial [Fistulina hepatica ATCC 64428]
HSLNPHFARVYELEDELGSGGYGFVLTARRREDGYEVAVKFIIKSKVPEHAWMDDEIVGRLPTEIMLLCLLDHPNIVKCLDLFDDPLYFYMVQELHGTPWHKVNNSSMQMQNESDRAASVSSDPSSSPPLLTASTSRDSVASTGAPSTPPHLSLPLSSIANAKNLATDAEDNIPPVQQFLHPGRPDYRRRPSHDLFECIEQSEHKRLPEDQARHVFRQVVDAVHHLNQQGVAHRDIKDENILIDKDLNVKLVDFGSATIVDPSKPRPYYTLFYGTTAYAASEILRKKQYQAAPAEVWTLGVLLSFLLTGNSPFPTVNDAIDGRMILTDAPDLKLSRSALRLMKICLDPNPKTRATIEDIRTHPWLS